MKQSFIIGKILSNALLVSTVATVIHVHASDNHYHDFLNRDIDGIHDILKKTGNVVLKPFDSLLASSKKEQSVKIGYYLQDPSVLKEIGILTTTVKRSKFGGPVLEDKDLCSIYSPSTDADGNFVYSKDQNKKFDYSSVFATVRLTMNMCRDDLTFLLSKDPKNKLLSNTITHWDSRSYGKLYLTAEAGMDANAFYNRNDQTRELKFFTFPDDNGTLIHSCRSSEIVAHEAGHSILDILHPEYFSTDSLETGAFHEAYGDLTAMFWTLYQPKLCSLLVSKTSGDLHQREGNFLAAVAEQFGSALGMPNGLRNDDDNVTLQQVEPEVHAVSSVFTGAMYDIFASAYAESIQNIPDQEGKANQLYYVGQHFRQMTLQSIISLENPAPNFSDLAFSLLSVSKEWSESSTASPLDKLNWSQYINDEFNKRSILVNNNAGLSLTLKGDKRVCHTLPNNLSNLI